MVISPLPSLARFPSRKNPPRLEPGSIGVEVHGLVEVGLGAQLVHVLVFGIEADADATPP